MENKKLLPVSILILTASILFSSIWLGYSLQKSANFKDSISGDNRILTLSEVAEYLNMTEKEISGIIETEKITLRKTGSFNRKMFPYVTIDNKQYFCKNEIDEWLKEASNNHVEYNTKG